MKNIEKVSRHILLRPIPKEELSLLVQDPMVVEQIPSNNGPSLLSGRAPNKALSTAEAIRNCTSCSII